MSLLYSDVDISMFDYEVIHEEEMNHIRIRHAGQYPIYMQTPLLNIEYCLSQNSINIDLDSNDTNTQRFKNKIIEIQNELHKRFKSNRSIQHAFHVEDLSMIPLAKILIPNMIKKIRGHTFLPIKLSPRIVYQGLNSEIDDANHIYKMEQDGIKRVSMILKLKGCKERSRSNMSYDIQLVGVKYKFGKAYTDLLVKETIELINMLDYPENGI